MSGLGDWLYALVAAALLVGLLRAMMPEGTVKEVSRIAGGLLLFLVLVRPLLGGSYGEVVSWLNQWQEDAEEVTAQGEETAARLEERLIAEKCAAYLVQQAGEQGIRCEVSVRCAGEDGGLILPVWATVTGALTEEERKVLLALAEEGLGLSAQQVEFTEGGEAYEWPGH